MTEEQQESGFANRRWKVAVIAAVFGAGLLLSAVLRFYGVHSDNPPPVTGYATLIYIGVTVLAAVLLTRLDVPTRRLGFGPPFTPVRYLVLAAIGVGLIQLPGLVLDPLTEQMAGGTRDLSRFSDVAGSPTAMIKLLALSWTVAAFGEELAFRIVLMRGIAFALGDSRVALGIALVVQAIVFGLVHAYQGPAGIIGTGINGLIFGGLVLAARGSIWPAVLAHGSSNTIGIIGLYLAA